MEILSIIGSSSALFIAILVLFFNAGRISARVDALESWRASVRNDMHEISDKLEFVMVAIKNLTVLMDERTNRRNPPIR